MSLFWSKVVHKLHPYVPGEQPKISDLIKLNANENPYGPSPKVLEAIRLGTSDNLRLYPDPNAEPLRQVIAKHHSLNIEQVFIGNGSDEVLAHIFQALFQHDGPLLFPDITYGFYPIYSKLYQIKYKEIALMDDFSINIDDYIQANSGIIFPNPNSPTGRLLSVAEVRSLLINNTDSIVVVDEAYIDFGGESAVILINEYSNLFITQTLSKSRSLAGIRVGYGLGHADLIEGLMRIKNSFNSYPVDRLAIIAGVASIQDHNYFQSTCDKIIKSRDIIVKELVKIGFKVTPSAANFIFVSHPKYNAADLAKELRKKSVIIRHFQQNRIKEHLRISIGKPEENQQLLTVLNSLV
ncbi:MAG: histidinol-phosphate transaminase [Piscirickettsiaceae bacterium]|nr:histidinol-phosphate transaminase [Piscirickettsiaceae bacterium]